MAGCICIRPREFLKEPVRYFSLKKQYIITKGWNPSYGARPLKRAIKFILEDKISDSILNNTIKNGDTITIDITDDEQIIFI